MTWTEATRLAKEEIALAKLQIHEQNQLAHKAEGQVIQIEEKDSSSEHVAV